MKHRIPVGTAVFSSTYNDNGEVVSVQVIQADRMIAVTMEPAGPGGAGRTVPQRVARARHGGYARLRADQVQRPGGSRVQAAGPPTQGS